MNEEILVNVTPQETRVAVLAAGQVQELVVEPTPPPPEGTYPVGSGVPAQYAEYWEALKPEVLLALIEEIRRARAKASSVPPDETRPTDAPLRNLL